MISSTYTLNIKTTCGHVGSNQTTELSNLKVLESLFTSLLGNITVQNTCLEIKEKERNEYSTQLLSFKQ